MSELILAGAGALFGSLIGNLVVTPWLRKRNQTVTKEEPKQETVSTRYDDERQYLTGDGKFFSNKVVTSGKGEDDEHVRKGGNL